MGNSQIADLVRQCVDSYDHADRARMESLLDDAFTFTSPYDDHIDRAAYFERCWPGAGTFASRHLRKVLVNGDECVVLYDAKGKDGTLFRNVEIFRRRGDRILSIEVFFGRPA